MTDPDPDPNDAGVEEDQAEPDAPPPFPETEHIKDDDEPLGANFA